MVEMFLPTQLAAMKLGAKRTPKRSFEITPKLLTLEELLPAWERIINTPRVQGFNDTVGDCVPTGACNVIQTLLARKGIFTAIPNELALQIYSAVTGYVSGDTSTDNGTDINQFLVWWEDNTIAGYKLQSSTSINPKDENRIRKIIEDKGYVLTVMGLATQQQNERLWIGAGTVGSWGYHCGCFDGFDGEVYNLTTWGQWQPVDRSFFNNGFVLDVYDLNLIEA
jgi:hypothetical protein